MSTKHVRTAADLVRFKCALKVECKACGNSVTLGGFDVARSLGTGELDQIQARLKCSRCASKHSRLTVLSPPPLRN